MNHLQDGDSSPSHSRETFSKRRLLGIESFPAMDRCLVNVSDMDVQATESQHVTSNKETPARHSARWRFHEVATHSGLQLAVKQSG